MAAHLRASLGRLRNSSIAGPGIASGLSIIGSVLLTFAGQMLIARHLGVSDYGQYALLVGWSLLLVLPTSLGIDGAIIRYMPGYVARGEISRFRRLILFCCIFQLLAVFFVTALLAILNRFSLPAVSWAEGSALVLAALLIAATVLGNTGTAILQAAGRVVVAQFYNNVLRPFLVLVVVAAWIFALRERLTPEQLFAATSLCAVIATALLAILVGRKFFRGKPDGLNHYPVREWTSYSIANLLGGLGQQALIQLPLLLIGSLAGTVEAGHYGVSSRLAGTVLLGLSALTSVSMPMLAKAFDRGAHAEVQRIATFNARLSFAFGLAVAIGFAVLGNFVLKLFGTGFEAAFPVLLILVSGLVASAALGPAVGVVAISGHPAVVAFANVVGLAVLLLLAWFWIPTLGAVGGSLAYVTGNFVAVVLSCLYARVKLGQDTTIFARASALLSDTSKPVDVSR